MRLAALLAGALIATPAMPAFALPDYFQAGGILDASTGAAGNGALVVGPSSGDFQAIGLDYKGSLHVVVNVSSLPDPTNTTRFTPSLELLIDGSERHFVDFLEFYDSRDDQRTLSLGTNEIDWPFELRTQIYPAPEQVTVSAIVKAVVRDSDCCVVDSISAFAAGDLTVYFTDPPASVAEPGSGLLLLAGVLGLSSWAVKPGRSGPGYKAACFLGSRLVYLTGCYPQPASVSVRQTNRLVSWLFNSAVRGGFGTMPSP